jgi:hypothetical protein
LAVLVLLAGCTAADNPGQAGHEEDLVPRDPTFGQATRDLLEAQRAGRGAAPGQEMTGPEASVLWQRYLLGLQGGKTGESAPATSPSTSASGQKPNSY